jgi:hypothetical protein
VKPVIPSPEPNHAVPNLPILEAGSQLEPEQSYVGFAGLLVISAGSELALVRFHA